MKLILINITFLLVIGCASQEVEEIEGCVDRNAENYDPEATVSSDSCLYDEFPSPTLHDTGISSLIILMDTITGLSAGDEIAVYDLNGVTATTNNADSAVYGEVLVGVADWSGTSNTEGVVATITAIESEDLSSVDGPILNGGVSGNEISFKVWKLSENKVYSALPTFSSGNGLFGDQIGLQVVSQLELLDP